MRKIFLPFLFLTLTVVSCSSGKPPETLFTEDIEKMVLVDRAMDFDEEITGISIVKLIQYEDQVEVEVRVEGWAYHKHLAIGATVPVSKSRKPGWAIWKFFCRKVDKNWVIVEKYKVEEGFEEQ